MVHTTKSEIEFAISFNANIWLNHTSHTGSAFMRIKIIGDGNRIANIYQKTHEPTQREIPFFYQWFFSYAFHLRDFFFLIQISALIEPHNSIIHFLDRFIFLTLLFYALGVIPTFVCLREIHGTVSLVKCELRAFHHSFQSPNVHHQFDAIRRGSISS